MGGCCLMLVHNVKHMLCKYFYGHWTLWRGVILFLDKNWTCTAIPPVFDLVPATVETCHIVEWVFLFPVTRIAYTLFQVNLMQPLIFCDYLQFVAAEVLGECWRQYFLTTEFHPISHCTFCSYKIIHHVTLLSKCVCAK
jgi:hypothetical protein